MLSKKPLSPLGKTESAAKAESQDCMFVKREYVLIIPIFGKPSNMLPLLYIRIARCQPPRQAVYRHEFRQSAVQTRDIRSPELGPALPQWTSLHEA